MNKYEMMFIIKATMEEANVKAAANNIKSLAESLNVKVESFKEMGQKKLAYPIKKEVSGYYFVMTMTANKDAIKEIDNHFQKLQQKVEDVIGNITMIKPTGENGYDYLFVGTNGSCEVKVILAGGYNIQRLHTRWIVNKQLK